MTLQQALYESMSGPFSVGYAITSFTSLEVDDTEVVVSTNMNEDTAVIRKMNRNRDWHFVFMVLDGTPLDWEPLRDPQVQEQVDKAYNKNPEIYVQ